MKTLVKPRQMKALRHKKSKVSDIEGEYKKTGGELRIEVGRVDERVGSVLSTGCRGIAWLR